MKNKINYSRLLRLMPLMGLLLGVLFYQLAWRETWAAYHSYKLVRETFPESSRLSISPTYTHARAKEVQEQYASFKVNVAGWKNQLWNTLIRLSQQHNCAVIAYPALKSSSLDELQLNQQGVTLSGKFSDLLLLVGALEKQKGIGKLSTVSFIKKDSDQHLSLTMIMTSIQLVK